MKKWIVAAFSALFLTLSASNAFALISASADIPLKYSFKDSSGISETPVSGLLLKLSLPIFFGLGLENYTVKPKDSLGGEIGNYKVTMYDIYFDLPLPIVNVSVGAGIGKGDLTPPVGGKTHDPAVLSQYFLSVGIPFFVVMDGHVGMYNTKGKLKSKGGGVPDYDVSATMYTLGVRVGF